MPTQEYKCPNCGGPVAFDPGAQEMACPYCESVISIEAFNYTGSAEQPPPQAEAWEYSGHEWGADGQQEMVVYTCSSCSGEIVGEKTLGAATCPFCGSPVVVTATFSGALRPDLIIPFKLGRQYALDSLERHYAKKRLLPEVFKERNHIDEVKGVYVPFWLYDAVTDAQMEYRGQKVRTWSDSRYIYTETSHYQIVREGTLSFDAVPADGSEKICDTLMESIEPYDMRDVTDFNNAYLAGFYANKYDLDSKQCSPRVNERVENSTVSEYRNTVTGYSRVSQTRSDVRISVNNVRYALLPVWLLGSTWEGGSFLFAMNGQTGKFVGDLPLDKKKKRRWFWGLSGILLPILLVLFQLFAAFFMTPEDPLSTHIGFAVASVILAFGIPLIIVTIWTNQLKSVRPKDSARDYVRPGSLMLRVQRDTFLYRNVSKVRIQSSSGRRR